MALNVGPRLFPAGQAPQALYEYVDIAAGTGITNFYAGNASSSAINTLSNNTFYSEQVSTHSIDITGTDTWGERLDLDFDVEFNLPRIMKGTAVVNVPIAMYCITNTRSYHGRADVYIKKVSGGIPVELVSASGAHLYHTTTAANQYKYGMDAIRLDVPLTPFKKGDILRLTIRGYSKANNSDAHVILIIGHDPQNRAQGGWDTYTFGTDPSILTFQAPFRIDL